MNFSYYICDFIKTRECVNFRTIFASLPRVIHIIHLEYCMTFHKRAFICRVLRDKRRKAFLNYSNIS